VCCVCFTVRQSTRNRARLLFRQQNTVIVGHNYWWKHPLSEGKGA
jgi:hypothetical protein